MIEYSTFESFLSCLCVMFILKNFRGLLKRFKKLNCRITSNALTIQKINTISANIF